MLRLSTPDYKRFVQADTFDITYGGGEANVAAALCNYGLNGTFVTKVPNNPIGQSSHQPPEKIWSGYAIHSERWRKIGYLFP